MSRVVRIGERLIELSGLHGIWLGACHSGGSRITLYYPKAPTQTIDYAYGKWTEAEKDKKSLEEALRPLDLNVSCEPACHDPTSRERIG